MIMAERLGSLPRATREQEFCSQQRGDDHEGELENHGGRHSRNAAARNHADDNWYRPETENLYGRIACGAVREERTDRGRQDDRQRGADAQLHADRIADAERSKHFIEDRHDNRAAADPEQAGQDPGRNAPCHDRGNKPSELRQGNPKKHAVSVIDERSFGGITRLC
jgi:hypothetical protein